MKNKKLIIYKVLLILLIIAAIVIGGIIFHKQYEDKVYDKENKELVEIFHKQENENSKNDKEKKEINLEYQGQKVIGLIKIPVIDLEYPILDKTTKLSMRTSISRYYGGEINEYGNVSLAGHNNYSGTMFGRNKNLKLKDEILLTDLNGNTIKYEIYDIFVTDPDDTTILETKDETIREVTLITCKNGRAERLIIKAKEIL